MAELRAHVARSLPAHMVPARMVLLDRLPTLANGRIDRAALPAVEMTARPQQADSADGYAAILVDWCETFSAFPRRDPAATSLS